MDGRHRQICWNCSFPYSLQLIVSTITHSWEGARFPNILISTSNLLMFVLSEVVSAPAHNSSSCFTATCDIVTMRPKGTRKKPHSQYCGSGWFMVRRGGSLSRLLACVDTLDARNWYTAEGKPLFLSFDVLCVLMYDRYWWQLAEKNSPICVQPLAATTS